MACVFGPISADGLYLHGMSSENGGEVCPKKIESELLTPSTEDTDSDCSMSDAGHLSTNGDSCSNFSVDDDSSDAEDGFLSESLFTTDQTLMIFDWDDTILPSTWIQRQGLGLADSCVVSEEQREQLVPMAQVAIRTLRAAKRLGTVILVTNAERGWIELSCRKFLPSLCPLLESIQIISARFLHEKPGVTLPSMWKSLAFRNEVNHFCKPLDPDRTKNIISFGDANHERLAVFQVTSDMSNCLTKSFKFMEQPHLEQLRKEHEMIYWCLRHIVSHDGTLDLQVQIA
jgi:hypothetical protein